MSRSLEAPPATHRSATQAGSFALLIALHALPGIAAQDPAPDAPDPLPNAAVRERAEGRESTSSTDGTDDDPDAGRRADAAQAGGGDDGSRPEAPGPAAGDGDDEPLRPEAVAPREGPVIITATRSEAPLFDVPYTTHVLDHRRIALEKASRYFPDTLRGIPGVHVQKTAHGQGSPYLRGFTSFRTLLLIDGIRLNHALMREGPNQYWATVDPLTIDRLEVVMGPSSVLYGSDAIGGTVNVITRSPELVGTGFSSRRRLYYRYGSAERSHIPRGELQASMDASAGALGGFTFKDFGDLRAGRGTGVMPNTGYESYSGDAKLVARPRDDLELVLAFQRVQQENVPRTHSTFFSKSFAGTTIGSDPRRDFDQRRTLVYGQAHWRPDAEWLSKADFSLSWHLHEELENRVRSDGRSLEQGFDDDVLGASAQFESPSPLGTWTYGVEYYRDFIDSFRRDVASDGTVTVRPRGPVADDSAYDLLGVYVQDRVQPFERLILTAGGRFTYAAANADVVDPDPTDGQDIAPFSEEFASAVGSLRALVPVTGSWNVFGGVSQGFRAPNIADLTRFDAARSGEFEVPTPGLDPEDFVSLEAGQRFDLGCVSAHAAYHYTFIDGLIQRFPTGGTVDGATEVTKANVGDGFVQGVELGGRWRFLELEREGTFSAFASFAWVEGEADTILGGTETRVPLSRIQPAYSTFGLRWDSPSGRWFAEATVTVSENQDRLAPRDVTDTQRIPPGGTPGYTVYTVRGVGELLDGLRAFAAVENLSDKDYRVHGSGQNEAGTNAVLGMDWTF